MSDIQVIKTIEVITLKFEEIIKALQYQLKESEKKADEWQATAKGWMLSCEKAQARVKVLEACLEMIKLKTVTDPALEAELRARAAVVYDLAATALKDGEK